MFDSMSEPIDFGFKRSTVKVRVMVRESAPMCISRECIFLLVIISIFYAIRVTSRPVGYIYDPKTRRVQSQSEMISGHTWSTLYHLTLIALSHWKCIFVKNSHCSTYFLITRKMSLWHTISYGLEWFIKNSAHYRSSLQITHVKLSNYCIKRRRTVFCSICELYEQPRPQLTWLTDIDNHAGTCLPDIHRIEEMKHHLIQFWCNPH